MECPICGIEAEEINPPTFDAKSIRCRECDYDISGFVWDMGLLKSLSREQRRAALGEARRGIGSLRPRITSYVIPA
jgi:hypothetical protein